IPRFNRLARQTAEAQGGIETFGQSNRQCAFSSPVRRVTSPASTASRLTLPNWKSGTARTPPQFYLLERSPFSLQRTANITRRSQRYRFAGSRLIQNISAPSLCGAATPKRFTLQLYRRFHQLPRRASQPFPIRFRGCPLALRYAL